MSRTFDTGDGPYGVAVAPGGERIYVSNTLEDTVTVIATATGQIVNTVPVGDFPHGIAVTPDGKRVFVANHSSDSISVLQAPANAVLDTIATGKGPISLAVSPDGERLFVTNKSDDVASIEVIDTFTHARSTLVSGVLSLRSVAVGPSSSWLYATNETGSNDLRFIDLVEGAAVGALPVGITPRAIAVHPTLPVAYVSNFGSGDITLVDTAARSLLDTVAVGEGPHGLSLTRDGARLYVANSGDDTVSVLDTTIAAAIDTVPVGRSPQAFGVFIDAVGPLTECPAPGAPTLLVSRNLASTNSPGGGEFELIDLRATIEVDADPCRRYVATVSLLAAGLPPSPVSTTIRIASTSAPDVVSAPIAVGSTASAIGLTATFDRLRPGANTFAVFVENSSGQTLYLPGSSLQVAVE